LWIEWTHHQKSIYFTPNFKIVGPSKSCKVYTKIDLHGAYNLVHIRKGDEWETAFHTCYGPFWICCDALSPYKCACRLLTLHEWCFLWIPRWFCGLLHWWHPHFSKNLEEHEWHVRLIWDKLREIELYFKLEKCEFHQIEMEFLNYIIFGDGIYMDSWKV
jgi:hypothetical protein